MTWYVMRVTCYAIRRGGFHIRPWTAMVLFIVGAPLVGALWGAERERTRKYVTERSTPLLRSKIC
jgi:hypothetical protein